MKRLCVWGKYVVMQLYPLCWYKPDFICKKVVEHFGKVSVPWGEIHRLRRGTVDLPLGGGPDVLNGVNARTVGDRLVGRQGDSFVLIAEFSERGVSSTSIHQYGASNRPSSPHYADQAPVFTKRTLKPTWRTPAELAEHTERSYSP